MLISKESLNKYDVPGPRYTSYPTAPEWLDNITQENYREKLREIGQSEKTLSLYFHVPFCESLCTFCACSVAIRKREEKYGEEYLEHLFGEIDLVRGAIGSKKIVKQLHWGGGTPTFLADGQLKRLMDKIQNAFAVDPEGEIAVEVDPRTITRARLKNLRTLGFNRISLGVQDFSPEVQKQINRVQTFAMVKNATKWCRSLGFSSVNFDLIYGLPQQSQASFSGTIEKVISLKPDRIALYSFAFVPWLKKHQQKIHPELLPSHDEKLNIFLEARRMFLEGGYQAIAMDHFALAEDELAQSFNEGRLYRNFMGYTVKPADEYLGFGVTAIGFLSGMFIQNSKTLPEYYAGLKQNRLPIERGKLLSGDDRIRQWVINSLMCRFHVDKKEFEAIFGGKFDTYFTDEREHIETCVQDNLLHETTNMLMVKELGRLFVRNICMGFDSYLQKQQSGRRYSQTV